MHTTYFRAASILTVLTGAGLSFGVGTSTAMAADVYLQAQQFQKTMVDGAIVPMWGFAGCEAGWVNCVATAPGPQIDLTAGDSLTIHLDNTLDVPVSIMVPGQGDGGDPAFFTDGLGRDRVESFTKETAPGTQENYTWPSVASGTYLYQSATYPSIEVPMGLYGALVVGPAVGVDVESVLLFSEVDPWLNDAVDLAPDVASFPSTVDYEPSYFLINGEASAELPAGDPGQIALLRFLNAGLESHTPTIAGLEMGLLAEDGFPYPGLTRYQSGVFLPAGKTLDVMVELPNADATYALFDRSVRSNYSHMPGGGVGAALVVGAGSTPDAPPTIYAVDDTFAVTEDSFVSGDLLANDVGIPGTATVSAVSLPSNGVLVLNADGTFTYTPNPDFSGYDAFTYAAVDGSVSYPAHVTLEVSFVNDAPIARADGPYVNTLGSDITVEAPGVLANDTDLDGDLLTAMLVSGPTEGSVILDPDGGFTFTGGTAGHTVTFEYLATDGVADSDPVVVTLELNPVPGLNLSVVDNLGIPVDAYRWLIQEDTTWKIDPETPPPFADTLVANFHKSYVPVVAQGTGALEFAQVAIDPAKQYYVSVLPLDGGNEDGSGHTIGGSQLLPNQTDVSVVVNSHPIRTAQISVQVFEDNAPTNGVWDQGEAGLGGYQISLEDPAGRYGQNGGTMGQDAFGNPLANSLDCFGDSPPPMGVILTCPDGTALIKNLPPGKYGVTAAVPLGEQDKWIQTSTIEGTRVIDAWVQAGEPPFWVEGGGLGPHASIGFVSPDRTTVPADVPAEARTNTITGNVTMFHDPRPPAPLGSFETGSYDALGHTRAWVGLNSIGGDGPNFATVQADPDGYFTIDAIPDGNYQVVIWDTFLDQIIDFRAVTLNGSGADLGAIPVNAWFTRLEHRVFQDDNQNGILDDGEGPLTEQAINLRFRDGSMYQSFPTDREGFVPFDEVFPFFNWMIAEVDFTRWKPTGLTVTVDAGGDVSGGPYPGLLYPQVGTPRTETGPVLLEAFQNFPGQTTLMDWGKAPYQPGENGGIAGIVYYASTRGENDPRLGVGDTWEPGIPGVKVRLYRVVATDFVGGTALSLVDEVVTDSWDASIPTDCPGEDVSTPYVTEALGEENLTRCYDGWRNWNQARPGVFDGGYAFMDIPPGQYVVEVEPPPGYELVKEEDVNVGFGDIFETAPVAMMMVGGAMVAALPDQAMIGAALGPEPGLLQPPCVGDLHLVPEFLSLFPDAQSYAPFAGTERPLCDRKLVTLEDQGQSAADFHLFTSTPVAAQYTGLILDDISIEQDPASPNFGEKWGPAYMPFSLRDQYGHAVYRGYSDGFGRYNGVAASTYDANLPQPSGYSPAMYSVCLNDAGDGTTPDPFRDPDYGTICTTLQFMLGTTTYLDTPVLPQAAFASGFNPADCAAPDQTPALQSISDALVAAGDTITLTSVGSLPVPNPAFRGPLAAAPYNEETLLRDFGFGSSGTVAIDGTPLTNVSWTDSTITATIPAGTAAGSYQLEITSDNGRKAINTVTVTVGNETPWVVHEGESIQAAIDGAPAGTLILVEPGVYNEQVILWKPVRLQGAGAGATVIDAAKRPADPLEAWLLKVQDLVGSGAVDLLPGQALAPNVFGGGVLTTEFGAGILVLAQDGAFAATASRIDGFTITNADVGGGIVVNGYGDNLVISNNVVTQNSGGLSGGIRLGVPLLATTGDGPFAYNPGVHIEHNAITRNGAIGETGAGGGVSINTGSDDYVVSENFICGNFTSGDGAGIGHLGLSDNGLIAHNDILFNQSFSPSFTRSGGGIFVGGETPAPPFLTLGAGTVTIEGNRIQGNLAGSGHGGGIRAEYFNGRDVELNAPAANAWYRLFITNNMIVDNVAGWSGGGISLQDVTKGNIVLNTIAHNDSTATVGALVNGVTNTSDPQPAGISSAPHNLELAALIPGANDFSNPTLTHNIIWENRAFSVDASGATAQLVPVLSPASTGDCPAGATYWDLGVLGGGFALDPEWSIVTDVTGLAPNNRSWDPGFSSEYCNGARALGSLGPIGLAQAFEEGGNFSEVRYGPLTQDGWDYHLIETSQAIDFHPTGAGGGWPPDTGILVDIDGDPRGFRVDLGADEYVAGQIAALFTTPTTALYAGATQ